MRRKIRSKSNAAEESDFGRLFGWLIERDSRTLGELEHVRWDETSQFWHEYRLSWRSPEDAVVGPDAWIEARLVLRKRRYADVIVDSFLTAPEQAPGVIAIRGACVPEERFHADEA